MQSRAVGNPLLRHGAAALLYALGFVLLRQVSFSYWVLFAGYRLTVLLLVPRRYWPALVVGEFGPLAFTAVRCLPEFGWLWSSVMVVPPIALAMPVVHACRERWQLFRSRHHVRISVLLLCALACSLIWTLANLAAVSVSIKPAGYPPMDYTLLAGRWLVGNYLGVLTVAPLVLMLREVWQITPAQERWTRLMDSRLFLESALGLLPVLMLLAWIGGGGMGEQARQVARMSMFVPVVFLALRHGWYGVAIGGTMASTAVVFTMPAAFDPGTMQAEVLIAFTISTMMMFGARISVLNQRDQQERLDARQTLALAQRTLFLGELRMRQTATAIEQVRGSIQQTNNLMLERLRYVVPTQEERQYRLQTAVNQEQLFRLADNLHPVSWRQRGLPAALREGAVARTLEAAGVSYTCDIEGRGLSQLSPGIHLVLYRTIGELAGSLCGDRDIGRIRVRLRGGAFEGRRWVVMRIDGYRDAAAARMVRWGELMQGLATVGSGLEAIRDQVALFEGQLREREVAHGTRISLILHNPE